MTREYMNNLYRDLLSNSPQTVTIQIPSDMGTGQIAQVVTKQGAVVSDLSLIHIYKHPAAYAREHDELAAYRTSNQANAACKEAIEAAIRDHYQDNRLDTACLLYTSRCV